MRHWSLTAALVLLGAAAIAGEQVYPVLSMTEPDCGILGAEWQAEYGLIVDDVSDLSGLSANESAVVKIIEEQLVPLGIVAVADYSCAKSGAPLDFMTVRVFVFENASRAAEWWQQKYQYDGWQEHYTVPADAGEQVLDSNQMAKRSQLVGNVWATSHHLQPGNEHLALLENILGQLGVGDD